MVKKAYKKLLSYRPDEHNRYPSYHFCLPPASIRDLWR